MSKLTAILITWAFVFGVVASTAHSDYWARNRMIAVGNPDRPGVFEVFQKATAGATDYFCAAGEYTRYSAHQHNTTRIYVVRGLGPSEVRPGRHSVIFSYVKYDDIPDMSDAEKGYSVSIKKPGYNLSAGHSTAFCQASVRRFARRGLF